MFETPILFLIFNRPENTKCVFKVIRQVKPKYFYVAADGPRDSKEGENEICSLTRQIATAIDWDCEYKTLFRDKNLGCKVAISQALNWFFSCVEEGIILEDDCLPSLTFFSYCEILLKRYRHNTNVISINGCNYGYKYTEAAYFFSRYFNAWGWASWRRVANAINYEIPEWEVMTNKNKIEFVQNRIKLAIVDFDKPWIEYWKDIFDSISDGTLNTWDYYWLYHQLKNRQLSVLPAVNLVRNIGFDENATHTTYGSHPAALLRANDISFPLKENVVYKNNIDYEKAALQPISYMYSRKPNFFYVKKWFLKNPFVLTINNFKRKYLKDYI